MNWQRGFWGIVFVISIIASIVGMFLCPMKSGISYYTFFTESIFHIISWHLLFGFLGFAAVWIFSALCFTAYSCCYYVFAWVVKGFRDENKKEIPKNK